MMFFDAYSHRLGHRPVKVSGSIYRELDDGSEVEIPVQGLVAYDEYARRSSLEDVEGVGHELTDDELAEAYEVLWDDFTDGDPGE